MSPWGKALIALAEFTDEGFMFYGGLTQNAFEQDWMRRVAWMSVL